MSRPLRYDELRDHLQAIGKRRFAILWFTQQKKIDFQEDIMDSDYIKKWSAFKRLWSDYDEVTDGRTVRYVESIYDRKKWNTQFVIVAYEEDSHELHLTTFLFVQYLKPLKCFINCLLGSIVAGVQPQFIWKFDNSCTKSAVFKTSDQHVLVAPSSGSF